jgi:uncharacterized membrane protein YecN with MAPEG domain
VIKALFFISNPNAAWDRVVQSGRSLMWVLFFYLLPMLMVVAAAEGFGLMKWGKRNAVIGLVRKFSMGEAAAYELGQTLLTLLMIVACAYFLKMLGKTERRQVAYQQTFTVVVYGLSPLFLLRLLDVVPVNPWVIWSIGIMFSISTLYHGLPRIMEPEPTNAFGLFFMSALVLVTTTGLERFITVWYLEGRMRSLDDIVAGLLSHLPF